MIQMAVPCLSRRYHACHDDTMPVTTIPCLSRRCTQYTVHTQMDTTDDYSCPGTVRASLCIANRRVAYSWPPCHCELVEGFGQSRPKFGPLRGGAAPQASKPRLYCGAYSPFCSPCLLFSPKFLAYFVYITVQE